MKSTIHIELSRELDQEQAASVLDAIALKLRNDSELETHEQMDGSISIATKHGCAFVTFTLDDE